MKIFKLTTVLVLLLSMTSSYAGNEGGGGSRLESAFRMTALSLIHQVEKNTDASQLCAADLIRDGLNSSSIKVVDVLLDNSGNPFKNQNLDAWTRPGLIQLRSPAWLQYLKTDGSLDSSVGALILHELYRTTSSCDDDTGALSTIVIQHLKQQVETKSTVQIDNNTLDSFEHNYTLITKANLSLCPGWYFDEYWKTVCPPTGCIAGNTHGYSRHDFRISLKNDKLFKGFVCTRTIESDTVQWLENISLNVKDFDENCVRSESCDSRGNCTRSFGTRSRSFYITATTSNSQITNWSKRYTQYSVCK